MEGSILELEDSSTSCLRKGNEIAIERSKAAQNDIEMVQMLYGETQRGMGLVEDCALCDHSYLVYE